MDSKKVKLLSHAAMPKRRENKSPRRSLRDSARSRDHQTSPAPSSEARDTRSVRPLDADLQLAKDGRHQNLGDAVRVGVGGGSAVLEVTVALGGGFPGDADRGAAVGDAVGELLDGARLVAARQALVVVLAVLLDALDVVGLELLEGVLDVLHAALDAHLLGGEVGVQALAVPIAADGLGVPRDLDAKVLGDAGEEESGDPKLVTHCLALARCHSHGWW